MDVRAPNDDVDDAEPDVAPIVLALPDRLLDLEDAGRLSPWAAEAVARLEALLTPVFGGPSAGDLGQLLSEFEAEVQSLEPPGGDDTLTGVQKNYDEYFRILRKGPTWDALVVGLVQGAHDAMLEIELPHSLALVDLAHLRAGLQSAAGLIARHAPGRIR